MTTVARLMSLPKRPRVLLDIKGLLMNSYFSGKDPELLKNSAGEKTINSAGFGMEVFLNKFMEPILKNFSPMDIIVVWDGGRKFRTALFPDYKASRAVTKSKSDPLENAQLEKLQDVAKRLLANLGAINMIVDGVEADDVIAMLVEKLDCPLMIYTVDADLLQLQSERVSVSQREVFFDEPTYKGVDLKYLVLHKSLVGDKSDEYPGVRGFGLAAYQKLIELYGEEIQDELINIIETKNFDYLKQAAEENRCKYLGRISEWTNDWQIMYELAKLHPELCYGMSRGNKVEPIYYTRVPSKEVVNHLLDQVSCRHLMPLLAPFLGNFTLADDSNFDTYAEFLIKELDESPIVAFDFETYDPIKHQVFLEALSDKAKEHGFVDVLSSIPTGGSFTFGRNLQHTCYVPEQHVNTKNVEDGVASVLRHLVGDWKGPICAHNSAFEEQVAKQSYNVKFNRLLDTMIMSSYVNEDRRAGLKGLSEACLNYKQTSYTELLKSCDAEDMRGVSGEQVLQYGCDDALVTAHLWKLFDLIMTLEGSIGFYTENETSVVHVLNRAFETGVNIDFDRMAELQKEDATTVIEGTARIRELLEMHSPAQQAHAGEISAAYFSAEYDYFRAKQMAAGEKHGWTREQIKEKLEAISASCLDAVAYRPMQEVTKRVEFKPTLTQFQKVIEKLKLVDAEGNTAVLAKLTGSGLTDFLLSVANSPSTPSTEEDQATFKILLGASSKFLSKPKEHAEELAPLIEFCSGILSQGMGAEYIGDELNFGSPKQMTELFYLKLGLPVRERTLKKKGSFRDLNGLPGSPSTDETAVDAALLFDCPEGDWRRDVLKTLLKVKEAMTRESLFYKPYPCWIHPKDGVVHPQIRNCGTVTRRPSGASPNLLQVSKGQTRSIFVPRFTGHVIISNDFSGQELRITGSESKDPTLIDCYIGGGYDIDVDGYEHPVVRDVHSVTSTAFALDVVAKELGKEFTKLCPLDERGFVNYDWFRKVYKAPSNSTAFPELGVRTPDFISVFEKVRGMAKVVNFLIIYGGNHLTLARKLGIPEDFAQRLMDLVFQSYARLAPWQEETVAFAEKYGYVQTAYGSRRHMTEAIVSRDKGAKSRMERQAVNSTVQGTAADILKVVLNGMYESNLMEDTKAVLIAPVYDEIVASVPSHNAVEFTHRLQKLMNITPPGHAIPMMAEASIGRNWCDQEELGDNPPDREIEACIERAFS